MLTVLPSASTEGAAKWSQTTRKPETSTPTTASNGGIEDRILAAIAATGKNTDRLTIEDLAPFDHFHTGGIAASRALATLANMSSGERVVDVGGGLGGPARMLAKEFGARVTVIDLTEDFINVGADLTARTGLIRPRSPFATATRRRCHFPTARSMSPGRSTRR